MKKYSLYGLWILTFIFIGCQEPNKSVEKSDRQSQTEQKGTPQQHKFAIAIHGGAGMYKSGELSDSLENAYKAKLKEAISTGHKILADGGSAVEAVQATINVMENSPLFNAGKGAVLTNAETAEMDASIMRGKDLNAGSVAGVKHIKNPINLAIDVMNKSQHVMLYGDGAETFAFNHGYDSIPQSYFITDRRLKEVHKMKKKGGYKTTSVFYDSKLKAKKFGTVGCVALDQNGNLAAGTSTGGLTNKKFGRIGDSPIIGAGTYANNKTCAVSCTGWGEYYIRGTVAYDMSALMEYANLSVEEATHKIIHEKQPELGGDGGIIAMDHYGNVSLDFNTTSMFRAQMDDEGNLEIALYGQDKE